MDRRTWRRLGAAMLMCGSAVAGCGGSVADRGSLLQAGLVPPLHATQPLVVQAGKPAANSRRIPIVGADVPVNYEQFTATAVQGLQQELSRQGVPMAPDASRRIEITLLYVDLLAQSGGTQYACLVDVRVTLGNGTVRGLQGREKSADPDKACQAALSNVAVATLNDPDVQRYITAPAVGGS